MLVNGQMSDRFYNAIFAHVLRDNHYELLLRTAKANLSRSMQWLGPTQKGRFNLEKNFQWQVKAVKSQIKLWPYNFK